MNLTGQPEEDGTLTPNEYKNLRYRVDFFEKRRTHARAKRQRKLNRRKRKKEQRVVQNFLQWASTTSKGTSVSG